MARGTRSLTELDRRSEFIGRHIGPREADVAKMLGRLGLASLAELIDKSVPRAIRSEGALDLPSARPEGEVLAELQEIAGANRSFVSMIGMGYSGTSTPGVIARNVLENPGWYTAYTPYQAEVSQGRLEALLNFQQVVMDLTGMDLANASLLDEATAAAEAMAMSRRVSKSKSMTFFVDRDCHPQTIAVIETRAAPLGIEVTVGDAAHDLDGAGCFGALVQYPASSGEVRDLRGIAQRVHGENALLTVASDLLALCLLESPAAMGADIVVGNAQRFGVPMGYGGPHAAFFATRDPYKRSTPGRLIGVSIDAQGRPALRMALQTREQHIRREKATSNICTAQVLLANLAGFYAVYHGPEGLDTIATRAHRYAVVLGAGLSRLGYRLGSDQFFDTLTVVAPGQAQSVVERAREQGINLRLVDDDRVGIACDETTRRPHLESVWRAFGAEAGRSTSRCSTPNRRLASRPICAAGVRPSSIRCSGAISRRPRCCATCAGCRPRTSRSIAP